LDMKEIKAWLHGPKFFPQGVALYEQYGSNSVLKRMFALGESVYNRRKLQEAMESLLGQPTRDENTDKTATVTPEIPEKPLLESKQRLLENLDAQWKPLYKKASYLHSQLEHVTRPERLAYSLTILSLFKQIQSYWNQKKYVEQHEALPPTQTVSPGQTIRDLSDDVEAYREVCRLRSRISKHKNKPAKAAEVAHWTTLKEQLERRLSHEVAN
jgi:chromatin segregation and condensation protein Rec8/ScpA/Scc1 (kleisin family)